MLKQWSIEFAKLIWSLLADSMTAIECQVWPYLLISRMSFSYVENTMQCHKLSLEAGNMSPMQLQICCLIIGCMRPVN